MKYLKKFGSETEYNTYISGSEVFLPNVSLIGVDDVRYNPIPPPPIISAGMICYHDGTGFKFCTRDEWDSTLGEVQGVVVVPSNHTPDGTARIMCITGVNPDGTYDRTRDVEVCWNAGPYSDTGLPNMNKVPTWSNTIGGTIGSNGYGYLPSDKGFTGATDCISNSLKYYNTSGPFIPSPYLEDGSQNPAYINTVEATTSNRLSDFDGKGNTAVLVGLGNDYTAANACNSYSTEAIGVGNWYLPACGELGYILPRFSVIQSALQAVGGVQLDSDHFYWTSTQCTIQSACLVYTSSGELEAEDEEINYYIRAFASVPIV